MGSFTDNQFTIIRDLVCNIESGGTAKYGYYSTKNNVPSIGIAAWVGNSALSLLRQIRSRCPEAYPRINILDSKLTVRMLTSPVGKIVQNRFLRSQLEEYASRLQVHYELADLGALIFCCFIAHHGGWHAVNKLLEQTRRPYNLDNIYTACFFNGVILPKEDAKRLFQGINANFKPSEEANISKGGSLMISTCGHDEKGGYVGGQAGDQSGTEWYTRAWYDGKWNYIMRHPDHKVREMIADFAEKAAKNDHIGYDQGQRTTFWYHLKASNYDPSKITVDCECDCSAGVSAIVKAVGVLTNDPEMAEYSESNWTGSMLANLKACGFQALSDRKYLTGDSYLARGDIFLNVQSHACINLTDGPNCDDPTGAAQTSTPAQTSTAQQTQADTSQQSSSSGSSITYDVKWTGYVKKNVVPRTWAGTEYAALKSISTIPKGSAVGVCCSVKANNKQNWHFVKINGKVWGFIPANTVSKSEVNKTSQTSSVSSAPNTVPQCVGKVTAALIDVKTWAGAEYSNITAWPQLAKGNLVDICDTVKDSKGTPWYYVRIAGKYYGFVHSSYLKRV